MHNSQIWFFMASVSNEYKFPSSNLFTSSRTHQFSSPPLNVVRPVSLESDESQRVIPGTEPSSVGAENPQGRIKLLFWNKRFPLALNVRHKSLNLIRTCTVIKMQKKCKNPSFYFFNRQYIVKKIVIATVIEIILYYKLIHIQNDPKCKDYFLKKKPL